MKVEEEFINTDKEYELYTRSIFSTIIEKCQKYRVDVDQFIFGNIHYDLSTFCTILNMMFLE